MIWECFMQGSSPLARGLREDDYCAGAGGGIIPARAGFTIRTSITLRLRGDHPRSRGVYSCQRSKPRPNLGSSPLARGLRLGAAADLLLDRIIPARAGFTRPPRGGPCHQPDHPRSRGVYIRRAPDRASDGGSSPLARGLLLWPRTGEAWWRIIPARAGFTAPGTAVQ